MSLSHPWNNFCKKCRRRLTTGKPGVCRRCEVVEVHEYTHPTFDMPLVIEASERSREQAEEMLASDATDADKALLVCAESQMSRFELDNLPEWDG